jgi:ABC-type uncharacterized transport system ATPase subunit
MKNELEELMSVAGVRGNTKNKIRETFSGLDKIKQKQFLEEFQFEIIRTTTKLTYNA